MRGKACLSILTEDLAGLAGAGGGRVRWGGRGEGGRGGGGGGVWGGGRGGASPGGGSAGSKENEEVSGSEEPQ